MTDSSQTLEKRVLNPKELETALTFVVESAIIGRREIHNGSELEPFSEFDVEENPTPIRKIRFPGYTAIENGDLIRAYIIKGDKREHVYIARDFREEEIAFKIEKLRNGKIMATYANLMYSGLGPDSVVLSRRELDDKKIIGRKANIRRGH